jgi:hypothetical protein
LIAQIRTTNETIRFAVYERDDGLFRIDEERYQAGDEWIEPYWSFDQLGLFGSLDDVNGYLDTVSPKPIDSLPG